MSSENRARYYSTCCDSLPSWIQLNSANQQQGINRWWIQAALYCSWRNYPAHYVGSQSKLTRNIKRWKTSISQQEYLTQKKNKSMFEVRRKNKLKCTPCKSHLTKWLGQPMRLHILEKILTKTCLKVNATRDSEIGNSHFQVSCGRNINI